MKVLKTICCAATIALLAAPAARADEWNKKTYLTFSGPVQIPGSTLPAGTYLFQLADPDNARHVVMVASKDGSHVYGMFLTIPNDRMEAPDENVVMFGESPKGTPQAVQAWWYPGDRLGEEFVYPKSQAMQIAKANHRDVLATDSDVNGSGSESDRMKALRGSNVGRVDENGNMSRESANAAAAKPETTTAQNNTAAAAPTRGQGEMTSHTPTNPSTSNKPGVNDGYRAKNKAQTTTAAATTTAPSNTVDGRSTTTAAKASKSSRSRTTTAVGTTGQTPNTNTANNAAPARSKRGKLPQTASSLSLMELLAALSLGGALSIRRVRRAAEAR